MSKSMRSKLLPPPTVMKAAIVGQLWRGVYAVGLDGKPLTLAIVDDEGHVVESGEAVSRDVWYAALDSYWQHLREIGVMREYSAPTDLDPVRRKRIATTTHA